MGGRWPWLVRPLAAFLASRVVVLAAVLAAGAGPGPTGVLRALASWDGAWYLSVAVFGYPDALVEPSGRVAGNLAFFPLYPLTIRALAVATGLSVLPAAIVVANVLGAAAALLLRALVRRVADDATADRSCVLFCFFPGSVVLSMAYAESLMLVLALGCLLALRVRRWVIAGAAAGLATLSRPNAVALVAACLWEAAVALRRDRSGSADGGRASPWRTLAAPLLAPAGFLGFMGFLWARTGRPDAWLFVQRLAWQERFDFGLNTARKALAAVTRPGPNVVLATLGLLFVVLAALLLWRWRPPAYLVVYSAAVVALAVLSRTLGARPRFVLTAFPLVVAVARASRGGVHAAVTAAFAAGLAALSVLYTVPFGAVP